MFPLRNVLASAALRFRKESRELGRLRAGSSDTIPKRQPCHPDCADCPEPWSGRQDGTCRFHFDIQHAIVFDPIWCSAGRVARHLLYARLTDTSQRFVNAQHHRFSDLPPRIHARFELLQGRVRSLRLPRFVSINTSYWIRTDTFRSWAPHRPFDETSTYEYCCAGPRSSAGVTSLRVLPTHH